MIEWWKNLSKKAKIAWCSGFAIIIVIIGALIGFYNSPNQKVKRADEANQKIFSEKIRPNPKTVVNPNDANKKKLANSISKNNKKYNIDYSGKDTATPSLDDLLKLRDESKDDVYLCGQVAIPDYDINVPIYEGISKYALAWGAGTAKPNQKMGEGNYALEAHNYIKKMDGLSNYAVNGWFFSRLQTKVAPLGAPESSSKYNYFRVAKDTPIYTLDNKYVYEYKIVKKIVIPDANAAGAGKVLADDEMKEIGNGKTPIITLATCYIQNGVTYPKERMVYVGEFVKKTPRSEFKNLKKVFHRDPNAASW